MSFPASGSSAFFWSTLGLQATEGLAASLTSTAVMASVLTLFPDRGSQLQPLVESLLAAGAIAGPTIGGSLYESFGYSAPFLLTAGASGVALLVGLFILPSCSKGRDDNSDGEAEENPLKVLLSKSGMWMAVVIEVWTNVSIGYLDATIALFLMRVSD